MYSVCTYLIGSTPTTSARNVESAELATRGFKLMNGDATDTDQVTAMMSKVSATGGGDSSTLAIRYQCLTSTLSGGDFSTSHHPQTPATPPEDGATHVLPKGLADQAIDDKVDGRVGDEQDLLHERADEYPVGSDELGLVDLVAVGHVGIDP